MLNYKSYGAGPEVLVFLHGYCENNTCFNRQVLFFSTGYRVIVPDLPGFGQSKPIPDVSISGMAQEVLKLLDALKVSTCFVFGHSMGGYVALAFAEMFSVRLKGFGLIHSTAAADSEERREKRLQVVSFIETHGAEKYIREFIPPLFNPDNPNPEMIDFMIQEALKGPSQGITGAALAMRERPDRLHVLKETMLPVFFAAGTFDRIIPPEVTIDQVAVCKTARFCELKNSGHMGMLEESEKLNREIDAFVNWVITEN